MPQSVSALHYFLRFQYLFALAGIALFAFFALNYFLSHAKRSNKHRRASVALLCSSLGILVSFMAHAVWADTLTVSASDPALAGQPLKLNGKFVGVVGNTISVAQPANQLAVHMPDGFYATMQLQLSAAALLASTPTGGECINNTVVAIRGAQVPPVSGTNGHYALQIPHLPLVRSEACSSQPSSLQCVQTAAQVEVKAVPEVHAAIWATGRDLNTSTPATISYPYCQGTTPRMDFVLRKPGLVNCAVDIRADGRTTPYSVQCQLSSAAH